MTDDDDLREATAADAPEVAEHDRVGELEAELAEAKAATLYAQAEIQNIRRRAEKEAQDARAYAATGFARDILSVSDNLERALASIPEELRADDKFKSLVTGLEATGREVASVFQRHGITRIAALGLPLDPNQHQAMLEVPSDEEPGTIVQEMQPGYMIKDRLLRPALVGVAKAGVIAPALLALALTTVEPAPPAWQGVWQGQVGTLPVRACLVRRSETWAFGSYYYLSKLRPIPLEQQDGSTVWQEGESSSTGPARPRWTFAAVGQTQLTGTWSDGKRSLPFRLTRVASADADSPCGSEAFNAPRWRALTVTRAAATKDGVRYTKLTYHAGPAFPDVALEGFVLAGSDGATQRINAALRESVPGKDEDWRSCVTGGLDAHGSDGDYDAGIAPTLITPRWLGADLSVGSYCGGAHPNSDTVSLTFDRASGAAVDLNSWLNDAAIERRRAEATELVTVRPALRRVIMAHAGEIESDCREAVTEAEFWDIGLERGGLRFTPEMPHVLTACANPAVVSWSALTRFLNRAGAAGRASLAAK